METLPKKNEEQTQLALLSNSSKRSAIVLPTISQIKDRANLLVAYNPSKQVDVCCDIDYCYFGPSPTLSEINKCFGEMTATIWLVPQLHNLSEFCGCKNKLEEEALAECASIIANEYFYLKLSEMMLFFYNFKLGKYGKFYGSVDPMVITSSLLTFIKSRNFMIDQKIAEEKEKKFNEWKKTAISYEEYCKQKGVPIKKAPQALDFKPKRERPKRVVQEDEKYSLALQIVENNENLDIKTLDIYIKQFKMKYGVLPSDFLKHKNNS